MTEGHRGTDIAIVGIGAVMPGARTTRDYWLNIINKAEVLSEIPRDRWDWRLYYDHEGNRSAMRRSTYAERRFMKYW